MMQQTARRFLITAVTGLGLTIASMAISYDFCMDGRGRGLPFAVVHPSHDEGEWAIPLYNPRTEQWGQEVDLPRTAGSVFMWSALAMIVARFVAWSNIHLQRVRKRNAHR